MEFFTQMIDICSIGWRPYKYEVDEIILDEHKALSIKFVQLDPFEINWFDAKCTLTDGELTLYYQDIKTVIPFDKNFDYTQTNIKRDGNNLVITIPSRIKIVSLSLRNELNLTNLNNV